MNITKVWAVYFSPGGHTRKMVTALAEAAGKALGAVVDGFDYTLPASRAGMKSFGKTDLVIWGSPVYAGRLPNKLLSYVENNFAGNGALAVPVVVFGNRNFDDALMELRNVLMNNGFCPVAGGAFVAQHAFSDILAAGRPDSDDMAVLAEFARQIASRVAKEEGEWGELLVKGANPPQHYYRPKGMDGEYTDFLKAKPKTDMSKCTGCGSCAKVCPMGSVNPEAVSEIKGVCIKCHACINGCGEQAKYFADEAFFSHKKMLEKEFQERKEPEVFL